MSSKTHRHPLFWVPTLYLAMGTSWVTINLVSAIMYKNMGISNAEAALWASSLAAPWTFKPLWAPLLEMFKNKKFFVVTMQFAYAMALAVAGIALEMPNFVTMTLVLFGVCGFVAATQDIGADGVYVTTLSPKDQAKFTGVQSLCWSIGPILASGVLVTLSGTFHDDMEMSWAASWRIVFLIIAGLMAILAVYHLAVLPPGEKAKDAPKSVGDAARTFGTAFRTFFQKKGIWMMIAFAFLYRFGQGLLDKIGPLFMMDEQAKGGLGLTNVALGNINGTFGTFGFLLGAVLGGLFVAKKGLKSALMLLCIAINVPNATYIFLAITQPTDLALITGVVTFEKLGFGFGSVGHMIYMMQQIAPGRYKTAHYAFATGLMGLCMQTTGMVSGYLQQAMGYTMYFVFVMVATIPSFIVTWLAPFHVKEDAAEAEEEPVPTPQVAAP